MSLSISVKEIVDKTTNTLLSIHPSWLRVSIDDFCTVLNGYAFKSSNFSNNKIGMPLIRIRDVQESTVETYYSGDYPKEYVITVGDILVGMDGDFNCKKWNNIPALLNQRVCKIEVVSDNYLQDFLYYALPPYLAEINQWTSVVTVKHLSSFSIKEIPLPLPPLNEQKRIVAKLDAIMPRIDAVKERLDKVPTILKRFRQSVLTAAITGRLTEQWRENHLEVESAEVLLKRIKEFRIKNAENLRELNAVKKNYSEGHERLQNQGAEFPLPESWKYCEINSIGNVYNGSTPSRKVNAFWNGTINWVSSGEVANLRIKSTREQITQEGYDNSSVRLFPKGTVLIAMIGEGKTRGQTAILDVESSCNQNVAAVVINHGLVLPEYLYNYFFMQYERNRSFGSGSGPKALNCQRVREIDFILPPLEEQKEIVRQVNKLFALADKVEAHYQKAKNRVDKLSQSVLAKAFRGELVPQDPTDEPAEKLLERILAEKAKLVGSKRSAGGRKKKSVGSRQSIVGSELQTAHGRLRTNQP